MGECSEELDDEQVEGDDRSGSEVVGTAEYACEKRPPTEGSKMDQLLRGPRTRFSLSPFLSVIGSSSCRSFSSLSYGSMMDEPA